MEIRKGIIQSFQGSWGSGIGHLHIKDSQTGEVQAIPAENPAAIRALQAAFGGVVAPGRSVDNKGGHIGQEIYWTLDDIGILSGFMPVEEAGEELIESYEKSLAEL